MLDYVKKLVSRFFLCTEANRREADNCALLGLLFEVARLHSSSPALLSSCFTALAPLCDSGAWFQGVIVFILLQSACFRGESVWGGEAGSTGAHKSCPGGARSHRGGRSDWTCCSWNYLHRLFFLNMIKYLLFKADFSQNDLVEFMAWVRSLSVKCENGEP